MQIFIISWFPYDIFMHTSGDGTADSWDTIPTIRARHMKKSRVSDKTHLKSQFKNKFCHTTEAETLRHADNIKLRIWLISVKAPILSSCFSLFDIMKMIKCNDNWLHSFCFQVVKARQMNLTHLKMRQYVASKCKHLKSELPSLQHNTLENTQIGLQIKTPLEKWCYFIPI